uniref:Uncharacterized protein n=1 Tax=Molossus molossus TaxID=27622 RepID=A0A7J8EEC3_MOLMO|nr:hypothetical protein HJG59_008797 [Molossus molossus]
MRWQRAERLVFAQRSGRERLKTDGLTLGAGAGRLVCAGSLNPQLKAPASSPALGGPPVPRLSCAWQREVGAGCWHRDEWKRRTGGRGGAWAWPGAAAQWDGLQVWLSHPGLLQDRWGPCWTGPGAVLSSGASGSERRAWEGLPDAPQPAGQQLRQPRALGAEGLREPSDGTSTSSQGVRGSPAVVWGVYTRFLQ